MTTDSSAKWAASSPRDVDVKVLTLPFTSACIFADQIAAHMLTDVAVKVRTMKSEPSPNGIHRENLIKLVEKFWTLLAEMQPHQQVTSSNQRLTKAASSMACDPSSSSSSPPTTLPAPPSSSTSGSATTMAAATSTTPTSGVIVAPGAPSPGARTPTSTPSSSSSNSAAQAVAGPSAGAAPGHQQQQQQRNKRQELSFAERIQVILARKSGKSMRQLAVQFGCGKTQILNILGQREAYLREWDEKQAESNPHISSRKRRSRRTGNEETNRLVWEWYTAQRGLGVRVTGPMLQREARSIARGLGIANFAASNGWLDSFRRLHNIGPQSRALQQQQQQSRLLTGQAPGPSVYSAYGTNGGQQQQQQQHDPSIPTISAAYSIDPESFGHQDAASPAASSSTGSSSHLAHLVLPPPPPLEAFGTEAAPSHHQPHYQEYYVAEDDEEDDGSDYYRQRARHDQHHALDSMATSTFTEMYSPGMMQQATPVQQHHEQQVGSPRLLIQDPRSIQQDHHHHQQQQQHEDRSTLLTIGQPVVHQQQVQQPMVRRSVLVSTRAAAAALESQLHEAKQVNQDLIVAGPSCEITAEEKRRLFGAVSSTESSSSGLEPLSASPGVFAQLTAVARQRGLAWMQYADDHGDVWLEIRPPAASAFRVPLYGYRTHLVRLLVDRQFTYWLEAIGHCVRSGTLRSATSGSEPDAGQVDQLLDLLAGGAVVCQGRGSVLKRVHQFHPKAAIEQGIAGSNFFTLPDYRYRAYDCARLVDAHSGTQCAACLRPPEPPPPPLEVISPPGAQRFPPGDQLIVGGQASQQDSRMDTGRDEQDESKSMRPRPADHEPLNLSVHPPLMGVLRFPSPGGFSAFAGFDGAPEPNQDDYRLAEEAAYLSLHPRERTVSAGHEWAAPAASGNGGYQRRARSDSPLNQHHLEAATIGSKSASPAFDPEFHTTWVKQETYDSPQSNGS